MSAQRDRTHQAKFRAAVIAAARDAGQQTCPNCGVWLRWDSANFPDSAEADHIIALADGGKHDPRSNGQVICRQCNQSKGGGVGARKRARVTPIAYTSPVKW